MKKLLNKLTLVLLLALLPSTTFARKYFVDEDFVYKKGNLEVKVENIEILWNWSGMAVNLVITNTGDEEAFFDASEFEILNTESNMALYSSTKNKNIVNVPYEASKLNILTNANAVNPNRTIKGSILILAQPDELKDLKNFDLNYAGQTMKVRSKR